MWITKLRAWADGRKTLWIARIYTIAGLLLLVKDVADAHGFDASPYLPSWLGPASPNYALLCLVTGVLFEGLRWITRNPVTYLQGTTDRYGNPL